MSRRGAPTGIKERIKIILFVFLSLFVLSAPALADATLYVDLNGDDSGICLVGAPCRTIQRAVDVGAATPLIVSVGAGTYRENVKVSGPARPLVRIVGAGSTKTVIDGSGACSGPTPYDGAVAANHGATVGLGSLTLAGPCSTTSDFIIIDRSAGYLVDDDVVFGAAGRVLILVGSNSIFDANYDGVGRPLTFSGDAVYAILATTGSRVITGIGVTNRLIGGQRHYTIFFEGLLQSSFNLGSNSSWSGNATGIPYELALNSSADTEQITTPLPGNVPGEVQSGSYYYTNSGILCVAGVSGCRASAPAATGVGASPSFSFFQGSGDQAGLLMIHTGIAAGSSGGVAVATASILKGPLDAGAFCTASLSNIGSSWAEGASVRPFYDSGAGLLQLQWANAGVPLVSNASYDIAWTCD